ncbi:MAG: hypothetical protein ACRDT8_22570 [Micromonosporaceae bacterium]
MDGREHTSVVPYGGAMEVARLDQAIHARGSYSRRCRACQERFPCDTRQRADAALGDSPAAPPRFGHDLFTIGQLVATGALLLVAAGFLVWQAVLG